MAHPTKLLEQDWKQKVIYTGTVIHIEEAADSFVKKAGGGGKAWCHYLKILVNQFPEAEPIDAQICGDQPTLDQFSVDDDIKFYWTAFARDRYTIQFSQISKTAESKRPRSITQEWTPVKEDTRIIYDENANRVVHPTIVTGTVTDRALNIAAHLFQYKEVDDDKFFAFTDKVKDYYLKNMQ